MHYVIGDVHNDSKRFKRLIKRIDLKPEDKIFVIGDLFDRCGENPDPVGVYFDVLRLGNSISIVLGNHDLLLAEYIEEYVKTPERRRKKLKPYDYNSFNILSQRLTEIDLLNLAEYIRIFPLQIELTVNDQHYLLAHARTSLPNDKKNDSFYTVGTIGDYEDGEEWRMFMKEGIPGYTSICGHTNTLFLKTLGGFYSDSIRPSIWRNDKQNVIMIDTGCGSSFGRLACICLETGEEFYE